MRVVSLIAPRRSLLIPQGRVGAQAKEGGLESWIGWFGVWSFTLGAALFFGGISGGVGYGLMMSTVGAAFVRHWNPLDSSLSNMLVGALGIGLGIGGLIAPITLFQRPEIAAWYRATYAR